MTLCLVTDRHQLDPDARTERDGALTLARWLEEAVGAGIDLIQLRERDLPARLLGDLARTVAGVASGTRTRVVVNDRADVALAAGCDGVHLPGDAPPVARVRALAASPWLVGRSVHSSKDARANADADYLLFGAVYDSGPKIGRGLDALRAVVAAVGPVPVIAIGGVTVPRAADLVAAGAAGVAAIRLFLPPGRATGALGISAATAALRAAFDRAATGHLQ
jgi:thiamine-phosphate pyrophosphorylase